MRSFLVDAFFIVIRIRKSLEPIFNRHKLMIKREKEGNIKTTLFPHVLQCFLKWFTFIKQYIIEDHDILYKHSQSCIRGLNGKCEEIRERKEKSRSTRHYFFKKHFIPIALNSSIQLSKTRWNTLQTLRYLFFIWIGYIKKYLSILKLIIRDFFATTFVNIITQFC